MLDREDISKIHNFLSAIQSTALKLDNEVLRTQNQVYTSITRNSWISNAIISSVGTFVIFQLISKGVAICDLSQIANNVIKNTLSSRYFRPYLPVGTIRTTIETVGSFWRSSGHMDEVNYDEMGLIKKFSYKALEYLKSSVGITSIASGYAHYKLQPILNKFFENYQGISSSNSSLQLIREFHRLNSDTQKQIAQALVVGILKNKLNQMGVDIDKIVTGGNGRWKDLDTFHTELKKLCDYIDIYSSTLHDRELDLEPEEFNTFVERNYSHFILLTQPVLDNGVAYDFVCPISREPMSDPVTLMEDGRAFNYERKFIESWFMKNPINPRNPITGKLFHGTIADFIPNPQLKAEIDEFLLNQRRAQIEEYVDQLDYSVNSLS